MSEDRLDILERQLRRARVTATVAVLLSGVGVLTAWTGQGATQDEVRTRVLVIEDEAGRSRVILGAPVPVFRRNPAAGMVVLDTNGVEQFGLTQRPDGSIGMGFDAPPGTGDDRNRERINLGADGQGGAYIRFLNRRTGVAGFLRLTAEDEMRLEFWDVRPDSVFERHISLGGERTVRRARSR